MIDLPKRLNSIQALRGVAALLVLFFHMAEFQRQMAEGNPYDTALVSGIWDRGWAGVDLFFIISGFIMVYVTRQTGRSFADIRNFIVARVTRIYPLWWVCAGIMAVYFLMTYGMLAAPDRVEGPSEAFAYAARSFLLIPQEVPPLLGLGWTLIHEMFFYIVFAGLLFLPRKYLPWALSAWAILTVIGSQFIAPAAYARNFMELVASPLSLEFIAGGFAGYLVTRGKIVATKALVIGGAALVFLALFFFPYVELGTYTTSRVAMFAVPFLLLTYGWVCCELKGQLKAPKWLSKLGDWSYSLYLTHYIVLVTLRRIYRLVFPDDLKVGAAGIIDNVIFALLALGLSIITAAIFYNLIERPSLKLFKKLRSQT
ncbi:MAG: acyltransferase [Hellea sp.]